MATPTGWSYVPGPDLYNQWNTGLPNAYPVILGTQSSTTDLRSAVLEANNVWTTIRKYGERTSSCSSTAGSTDSRLSENFEAFNSYGNNRPPSPPSIMPSIQLSPIFDSSPFKESRHKLRPDSTEESNDGPWGRAGLPGPPNPREAYLKIRRLIRTERQGVVHGESMDQSSSCASISVDGKDIQAPGEPPDTFNTRPPKQQPDKGRQILSRMRVAVVKWQTRKQFFEFTADPSADSKRSSIHTWRRRRATADALVSTGSKGKEWAALVARRFTKTTERQITGLRAILRLRAEEEFSYVTEGQARTPRPDCSDLSYRLLNLVFLQFDPQTFFHEVVPAILRDWPPDKPCSIAWLARVIAYFMPRIDAGVMSRYGRRVIQNARRWTNEWLYGMWLLSTLFLGQATCTENRTTVLSVAKLILHIGMEALGSQTSDAVGTVRTPDDVPRLRVLYSVVLTCLSCGEEDTLYSVVPSVVTLGPFVEACIEALCANGSMTCSALKALTLLRNMPNVMEDIPQSKVSILATCCLEIVLGSGSWNKVLVAANCREDPFPLIPEEDAFDILCRLPQPAFPKALAAALANCPVCLDPSSLEDHLKLFDMLEPLLWLSNMPSSVPEAHRALVNGDACEFLTKIILDSPQETWSWQDRAVWRVKGEAITCLGNIIEKMDATELGSRLGEDVVKATAEIRDNTEAPQAQRDQGTFTLIRYKAAAGRCGVVPFCSEKLVQDPESPTARE